jgi:hypothetical protein
MSKNNNHHRILCNNYDTIYFYEPKDAYKNCEGKIIIDPKAKPLGVAYNTKSKEVDKHE